VCSSDLAVLAAVTWRALRTALLLGLPLCVLRELQNYTEGPPSYFASGLVITTLGSLCVMLAALAADEAIQRGAPVWAAYSIALLAASFVTALGQWYIRTWLHLYTVANRPGVSPTEQRIGIIFIAGDVLILGGFAMLAYLNRRSAERILEGVRNTELRRVQIERRLTESRLAAAQAQIDPRTLFAALEEIRSMYSLAAPHAEQRLDELIQGLQATVTGHVLAIGSGGSAP
jgi:hypothetical protein